MVAWWGGSCRSGVGLCRSEVSHVRVGWGGSCMGEVGWVM